MWLPYQCKIEDSVIWKEYKIDQKYSVSRSIILTQENLSFIPLN